MVYATSDPEQRVSVRTDVASDELDSFLVCDNFYHQCLPLRLEDDVQYMEGG